MWSVCVSPRRADWARTAGSADTSPRPPEPSRPELRCAAHVRPGHHGTMLSADRQQTGRQTDRQQTDSRAAGATLQQLVAHQKSLFSETASAPCVKAAFRSPRALSVTRLCPPVWFSCSGLFVSSSRKLPQQVVSYFPQPRRDDGVCRAVRGGGADISTSIITHLAPKIRTEARIRSTHESAHSHVHNKSDMIQKLEERKSNDVQQQLQICCNGPHWRAESDCWLQAGGRLSVRPGPSRPVLLLLLPN